jgi:Zn-dependent protease with chaperone function
LIDVILFILGAAFAIATLAGIAWGYWSMTWVGKILAQFFVYSVLVWWIHHWESDTGWKAAGAWFFCIVLSSIIEGINLAWQRRMAGPAI